MNSKNVGRKIVAGTIFALVAGYVVGILTAPKSGKETRQDIKNASDIAMCEAEAKLKDFYAELSKVLDQATDKAKIATGKGREKLDDLMADAREAQIKVKEVLSAIRHGDAEDPDLRSAIKQASQAKKDLVYYLKNFKK